MISQIFFPNLWRHRHLLSTRCWYLQHPELCSCNNLLLAPPSFISERINDPSTSWLYFAQNSPATHCSAACFALSSLSNKCFIASGVNLLGAAIMCKWLVPSWHHSIVTATQCSSSNRPP